MADAEVSVRREGWRRYVVRHQDQSLCFRSKRAAESFAADLRSGSACIVTFEPVTIWP